MVRPRVGSRHGPGKDEAGGGRGLGAGGWGLGAGGGGYAEGSMGEPTLTEETAFSPRRFLLFAFLLLSLSLSLSSSPVPGELPARERASTSTYSPSFSHAAPVVRTRAPERGGRIKL